MTKQLAAKNRAQGFAIIETTIPKGFDVFGGTRVEIRYNQNSNGTLFSTVVFSEQNTMPDQPSRVDYHWTLRDAIETANEKIRALSESVNASTDCEYIG